MQPRLPFSVAVAATVVSGETVAAAVIARKTATTTTEAVIKGQQAIFLVAGSGSAAAVTRGLNGRIPARVDANTQQKIKDWFDRLHISLYWIVLRQPGGLSIFDPNFKPVEDQPLAKDLS